LGAHVTAGLDLRELRKANVARLGQFRNSKGKVVHLPDGSDWSLTDWYLAAAGELGEVAGEIKKHKRGDLDDEDLRERLGHEIADVITYLDILAFRAGIDLADAVRDKFNIVSERCGADTWLSSREGLAITTDGETL
jgi:NTP pyrophosphatase (non-canonical NTP hydrolase)